MYNKSESEHFKITKKSKTNFFYSFTLLSSEKNEAINTVYAFCRKTDDIVDDDSCTVNVKFSKLNKWREELEKALEGDSEHILLKQLSIVIKRFNIPIEPFFDLIKGMKMDLQTNRYKTFEELYIYCYRAAATVGLMCIEIFGYRNPGVKDFAVNLGIAMQLTNILRDIKKDVESGRIYIPEEDIKKFGYSEKELLDYKYNESFTELMKFECKRARGYYKKANNSLSKEDKGLMFSALIMEHIYFNVLEKIEKMNYNVFEKTAKISTIKKLLITFGFYFKYKLIYSFKGPRFAVNTK
jgi:phytoene synthase